MRLYETSFVVSSQVDEPTLDRTVKQITAQITGAGGKIVVEDRLGVRRFAYPVNGMTQGHFTSILFNAPAEFLAQLERSYRLDEIFMRHLTIVYEGDPEKVREEQKALHSAIEAQDQAERERRNEAREAREAGGFRRDRGDRGDRGHRGDRGDRGDRGESHGGRD